MPNCKPTCKCLRCANAKHNVGTVCQSHSGPRYNASLKCFPGMAGCNPEIGCECRDYGIDCSSFVEKTYSTVSECPINKCFGG